MTYLNQKTILEPLSALLPIREIPKDSFLHEFSVSENLRTTLETLKPAPEIENLESEIKNETESILELEKIQIGQDEPYSETFNKTET